jgi:hypothetical protein
MHQMRISTNKVSSVMLRPKKKVINPKIKIMKTVKEPGKNPQNKVSFVSR